MGRPAAGAGPCGLYDAKRMFFIAKAEGQGYAWSPPLPLYRGREPMVKACGVSNESVFYGRGCPLQAAPAKAACAARRTAPAAAALSQKSDLFPCRFHGPHQTDGALCPAPGRPEALLACSIKATVFGPGGPFEMQPGARLLPEGFRLPASAAKGRPPGGPQGKAFRVLPGHRARPPPAQAERANAHALLLRPLLPGAASAPRPQRSETCTAKISCGISTPR